MWGDSFNLFNLNLFNFNLGDEISLINPALVKCNSSMKISKETLDKNTFVVILHTKKPDRYFMFEKAKTPKGHSFNGSGTFNGNGNFPFLGSNVLTRSNTVMRKLQQNRNITDYYEFRNMLGAGTSGSVYLAVNKLCGREWAIKMIDTRKNKLFQSPDQQSSDEVTKEAQLLRSLRHPNIIYLEDIFADGSRIFLVMELVKGQDLYECIVSRTDNRFEESEAKAVLKQVLDAMVYLHENKVAHRDLKPENILVTKSSSRPSTVGNELDSLVVKLSDFGLAKELVDGHSGFKSFCGTPEYFAPEVFARSKTVQDTGSYSLEADMWSIGVILYVLLSGSYPFSIGQWQYSMKEGIWKTISHEAKTLIRNLLEINPKKRFTAKQAIQSNWFKRDKFTDSNTSFSNFHDSDKKEVSFANGSSSADMDIFSMNTPPVVGSLSQLSSSDEACIALNGVTIDLDSTHPYPRKKSNRKGSNPKKIATKKSSIKKKYLGSTHKSQSKK